ncbi:Uncharacterised protein [Mycobacterium tuberculosis]|nr:Uncharacterised protein [Mycobacterium tuberculosis]
MVWMPAGLASVRCGSWNSGNSPCSLLPPWPLMASICSFRPRATSS